MNYLIRYLKEVRDEISDAYIWYEDQKAGLGDSFVDKIEETIERIQNNPQTFPIVFENK